MAQLVPVDRRTCIGIDVSDRQAEIVVLDAAGEVIERTRIAATATGVQRRFGAIEPARIALEAGHHSPWMSRLLAHLGHEVVVANARRVELISRSDTKNDRADAELLARLVRADPRLLAPVQHRSEEIQADRALLKARHCIVRQQASMINLVRGAVKSAGGRIPATSAEAFARKAPEHVPEPFRLALLPVIEVIARLTEAIRQYDRAVERLGKTRYPVTKHLRAVPGVGPVVALAYVLTIGDPARFRRGRSVGAYLGLRPRQCDSGAESPELHISKSGDQLLRLLLVQSAQYILGPFGPDCDLRRFGLKLAARGRKRAKRVAITAVARKLAVLLHALWRTGEVYEPLRGAAA